MGKFKNLFRFAWIHTGMVDIAEMAAANNVDIQDVKENLEEGQKLYESCHLSGVPTLSDICLSEHFGKSTPGTVKKAWQVQANDGVTWNTLPTGISNEVIKELAKYKKLQFYASKDIEDAIARGSPEVKVNDLRKKLEQIEAFFVKTSNGEVLPAKATKNKFSVASGGGLTVKAKLCYKVHRCI